MTLGKWCRKEELGRVGLGVGSGVKGTDCSCRGPGFNSQHSHGDSQPSATPFAGDQISSSDFRVHQAHTRYTDKHVEKKPHTHNIVITIKSNDDGNDDKAIF